MTFLSHKAPHCGERMQNYFWIYFCCTQILCYTQACRFTRALQIFRLYRPQERSFISKNRSYGNGLRFMLGQLGRQRWLLLSIAGGNDGDGVDDGGARGTGFSLLPPQSSRFSSRSYTGHFESLQTIGPGTTNFCGAPVRLGWGAVTEFSDGWKRAWAVFYKSTGRWNNAVECTLGRPSITVRKPTDGARAGERTKRSSEHRRVRVNDKCSYQRGVRTRTHGRDKR